MKLSTDHTLLHRFFLNLFFIVFLGLSNWGFAQDPVTIQKKKSIQLFEKTNVSENIVYKTNGNGHSVALDIYSPKGNSIEKFPVLIYIHGGGWVEGDKIIRANNYVESTILKLVEQQYAVISINYTLVSKDVHFPLPVQDTKDAIRWVRKNAEKYHFDTNNIGLFGTSAGAHLSLLSAYTQDNEFIGDPELSSYSAKVNYVVNNFGPTDLNKLLKTRVGKVGAFIVSLFSKKIVDLREKLILGISGYDINKDKRKIIEYFETISPVSYVGSATPTLILQGNRDKIVPLHQSKILHHKLINEGVKNTLTIVDGGDHGFRTTNQAYLDQLVDEMVRFIISQKK
ncbi:esterase [Chryseobacterium piperi]|uniref:Esterase n=1 Tax=Chryseobacterium piperi TaxID=558152 RepID=A0A086AZA9_9FLAO|nr:alpha/beta hydrolase [Chryseobacterium piperi]ASW74531.1 alpha/beta hydrolase [Chryseobacterium piperi]KFF22023.1 esterase [Chryseobacterium piperi]